MERQITVFHDRASELQTTSEGNTGGPQAATGMHLAVRIFLMSDSVCAGEQTLCKVLCCFNTSQTKEDSKLHKYSKL